MSDVLYRRMRDKGAIALVALLFSIGLWFRVVGGEKIEITKAVKLEYKIPKDLSLFAPFPTEVSVRVQGPAPFVQEFQKQELAITVDLSKFGTGDHEVSFKADQFKVPLGIDLTLINPPSIKVFLDREMVKTVTVRPVFSTQLPEDYKVESVVAEPSSIEVKGARTRLRVLSSVPTEIIYITDNSLEQHFEAALNLADFWGIQPTEKISSVHVQVSIKGPSKRKLFRAIPLHLKTGSPSQPKLVDIEGRKIRLRPKTVDLFLEGPQTMLDELTPANLDIWAQVPELKKGISQSRITWKLAPEIRIINRSTDSVTIQVP